MQKYVADILESKTKAKRPLKEIALWAQPEAAEIIFACENALDEADGATKGDDYKGRNPTYLKIIKDGMVSASKLAQNRALGVALVNQWAENANQRTRIAGLVQSPARVAAGLGNIPGKHILGDAKVSGYAVVYQNAQAIGSAHVSGSAQVSGHAQVGGYTQVSDIAKVYGYALVDDNAKVFGSAEVYDNSQVFGDARVFGYAQVSGKAKVGGKAKVSGTAMISGKARIGGTATLLGGKWDGSEGEILSGTWKSPGVPA